MPGPENSEIRIFLFYTIFLWEPSYTLIAIASFVLIPCLWLSFLYVRQVVIVITTKTSGLFCSLVWTWEKRSRCIGECNGRMAMTTTLRVTAASLSETAKLHKMNLLFFLCFRFDCIIRLHALCNSYSPHDFFLCCFFLVYWGRAGCCVENVAFQNIPNLVCSIRVHKSWHWTIQTKTTEKKIIISLARVIPVVSSSFCFICLVSWCHTSLEPEN